MRDGALQKVYAYPERLDYKPHAGSFQKQPANPTIIHPSTYPSINHSPVPADKPLIRDVSALEVGVAPKVPANNLVGPHNEGAKVVLLCETQGGYPEPSLTWWRDGRLVDDSYESVSLLDGLVVGQHSSSGADSPEGELGDAPPSPEESGSRSGSADSNQDQEPNKESMQNRLIRNRLELGALTRADLLANYSCQASNTKLSEAPSNFVMIDMNREYLTRVSCTS